MAYKLESARRTGNEYVYTVSVILAGKAPLTRVFRWGTPPKGMSHADYQEGHLREMKLALRAEFERPALSESVLNSEGSEL